MDGVVGEIQQDLPKHAGLSQHIVVFFADGGFQPDILGQDPLDHPQAQPHLCRSVEPGLFPLRPACPGKLQHLPGQLAALSGGLVQLLRFLRQQGRHGLVVFEKLRIQQDGGHLVVELMGQGSPQGGQLLVPVVDLHQGLLFFQGLPHLVHFLFVEQLQLQGLLLLFSLHVKPQGSQKPHQQGSPEKGQIQQKPFQGLYQHGVVLSHAHGEHLVLKGGGGVGHQLLPAHGHALFHRIGPGPLCPGQILCQIGEVRIRFRPDILLAPLPGHDDLSFLVPDDAVAVVVDLQIGKHAAFPEDPVQIPFKLQDPGYTAIDGNGLGHIEYIVAPVLVIGGAADDLSRIFRGPLADLPFLLGKIPVVVLPVKILVAEDLVHGLLQGGHIRKVISVQAFDQGLLILKACLQAQGVGRGDALDAVRFALHQGPEHRAVAEIADEDDEQDAQGGDHEVARGAKLVFLR